MTDSQLDSALTPPSADRGTPPGVTRDQVRHVAALASLELTVDEEASMERDLNAILGYVAELNELNTDNIEPLSQVTEILATRRSPDGPELASALPLASNLRVDEPRPSLSRSIVMHEAPATDGTFFKVPKVIER